MKNRNTNNCCVEGCFNKQQNSELSFFKLPQDSVRRNTWLKEMGRSDLLNKTDIKPNSYKVCSIHFDSSVMSEKVKRKLLPSAVPTKCLPHQPQPSTSTCKIESNGNCDESTQTMEQEAQTTHTLSSCTPRKRALRNKLQTSEKKRRL